MDEPILGSDRARLSSYALCVLVLRMFNTKRGREFIKHPLDAFAMFFEEYMDFPWKQLAVTIHGSTELSTLLPTTTTINSSQDTGTMGNQKSSPKSSQRALARNVKSSELIPSISTLQTFTQSRRPDASQDISFPIRSCNIVDPLNVKNNLGRSLSKNNFERFKLAILHGRQ